MRSAGRALEALRELEVALNAPDGRINIGEVKGLVYTALAFVTVAAENDEVEVLMRDMEGTAAALAEGKARNVPKDAVLHILSASRRVA